MDSIVPNNPQQPLPTEPSTLEKEFEILAQELREANDEFQKKTAETTAALEAGLADVEQAMAKTNAELEQEVEAEREGILKDADEM